MIMKSISANSKGSIFSHYFFILRYLKYYNAFTTELLFKQINSYTTFVQDMHTELEVLYVRRWHIFYLMYFGIILFRDADSQLCHQKSFIFKRVLSVEKWVKRVMVKRVMVKSSNLGRIWYFLIYLKILINLVWCFCYQFFVCFSGLHKQAFFTELLSLSIDYLKKLIQDGVAAINLKVTAEGDKGDLKSRTKSMASSIDSSTSMFTFLFDVPESLKYLAEKLMELQTYLKKPILERSATKDVVDGTEMNFSQVRYSLHLTSLYYNCEDFFSVFYSCKAL